MKKEAVNNKEYTGYVYIITNNVNDKVYIGETLSPLKKRFRQHCWAAYNESFRNFYFYRAIRKYGKENFEIQELERVVDTDRKIVKSKILELEEKYIKEYDSFNNGYNSNTGGRHYIEVKLETRKLQSEIKLNNPETFTNLEKARTVAIEKVRVRVVSYNYVSGEKLQEFESIKSMADFYNKDSSFISRICRKGGNFFRDKEGNKLTARYIDDPYIISNVVKVYNINGELLNSFTSIEEGAKYYNIKYKESIVRCCKGLCKYTGKAIKDRLVWRYINDDFNKYE